MTSNPGIPGLCIHRYPRYLDLYLVEILIYKLLGGGLGNLGTWAATGNPDIQAIGSWARQSRYLGLGT